MSAINETGPGSWPGWREILGSPKDAARAFALTAFLAAWVAVIGPFGNYQAGPLEMRLAYHVTLGIVVVAVYRPGLRLGALLGARFGVHGMAVAIATILIISAPMSQFVGFVGGLFFPRLRQILSPLDWYLQLVTLVIPISLAFGIFEGVLARRSAGRVVGSAAPRPASRPRLLARLPAHAGEVHALHVEDHYLRVHTAGGSTLLYFTLSEALQELEGLDGLQIHRSWWVARGAIVRVVRRRRRAEVHLSNGVVAPVARARVGALKAAVGSP